jgi:hypothetical protein
LKFDATLLLAMPLLLKRFDCCCACLCMPLNRAAAGMQDEEGAGEQMEPLEQQKPKPKRVIKKRAKLTLEQLQVGVAWQHVCCIPCMLLQSNHRHTHNSNCCILQAPNGLPEVFEKFPKWFQEGYKGKGHEVGPTCCLSSSSDAGWPKPKSVDCVLDRHA